MKKRRHVPARTCAGCRRVRPKREMVRIVRSPDGSIGVDPTGKRAGRGAYVCPDPGCWKGVLRPGWLGRALKTEVRDDDLEELRQIARQFHEQIADSSVPALSALALSPLVAPVRE